MSERRIQWLSWLSITAQFSAAVYGIISLSSCSYFKPQAPWEHFYQTPSTKHTFDLRQLWDPETATPVEVYAQADYLMGIRALGERFLADHRRHILVLEKKSTAYLVSLVEELMKTNELVFTESQTVEHQSHWLSSQPKSVSPNKSAEINLGPLSNLEVFILNHPAPLYFSLPPNRIIFSTALLKKYIIHEGHLASLIAQEGIRLSRQLYQKPKGLPLPQVSLERILAYWRLPHSEQVKLNEAIYFVLSRSRFHGDYFLSWLQLQNRNHLDFMLQWTDTGLLNREEFLLKNFIINNYGKKRLNPLSFKSSQAFYDFLNRVNHLF